ncbi:hypothetical protein JKP88DRAFT_204350 [Tribonema minus]|uniref:Core domain-containing protein n=1 Tax=Tribonema minus TaxID=303371 RepID=A0A835ZPC5_9STRA|nr:hypothetical protein JKP88DRAFT_204350 [Tribonema minus]
MAYTAAARRLTTPAWRQPIFAGAVRRCYCHAGVVAAAGKGVRRERFISAQRYSSSIQSSGRRTSAVTPALSCTAFIDHSGHVRQNRCLSTQRQSESTSNSSIGPQSLDDAVIVTKSCAERINQLRKRRGGDAPLRLRLSVEGGGCSGFQYTFTMDDGTGDEEIDTPDIIFERDGAQVVIDEVSLGFVKGATVDFQQDMMRAAFSVLNNPNSENACGCGSSFAVKAFEANPARD